MKYSTRFKGNLAEKRASEFLKSKGFRIIERNFYCKGGEIDIIAFKDNVFHFIEVKSGSSGIYNITPKKLSRILKCLNFYLLKNNITSAYTIDAIIVNEDIEFIENVTM